MGKNHYLLYKKKVYLYLQTANNFFFSELKRLNTKIHKKFAINCDESNYNKLFFYQRYS